MYIKKGMVIMKNWSFTLILITINTPIYEEAGKGQKLIKKL